MARKSNVALTIVTAGALIATLAAATAAAAEPTARTWYWTERHTAAEIYLSDAKDLRDRQPAAIIRGGYISDKVDCTGLPPLLRRNGLRMYRRLDCSFRVTETNELGDEVDTYWSAIVTPKGREDYLARWRRYA